MTGDITPGVPSSPADHAEPQTSEDGRVGARFRRSLTDAELASIAAAARRRGRNGGLNGAIRATWDILLLEAEGVTMAEAVERGLRFHPRAYAIPQTQHGQVAAIWRKHRGPNYPNPSAADLRWFNIGPASYPDDEHSTA